MDLRDIKEFIKDTLKYFIIIILVLLTIIYVISLQQVVGPSMKSTFDDGDIIIVNKFIYHFKDISRYDVVVIKHQEKIYVKRIIGLPNEHIEYKNNILYIGSKAYSESFTDALTDDFKLEDLGYRTIPNNMYLVLGDNRENSEDSREFGLINKSDIIGRASIRIWPLTKVKFVH